jgi:predicted DCC family thiol-disulfide oxidoreductase YuxK
MIFELPKNETQFLARPLLIWDGNCGFCKYWVMRWDRMTGDTVDYAPYQQVEDRFESLTEAHFKRAAYLIEPDGEAYRGMAAAYRTLAYGRNWGWLIRWYRRSSLFRQASDSLYGWIARHRPLLFRFTKALFGKNPHRQRPYWLFYLIGLIVLIRVLLRLI